MVAKRLNWISFRCKYISPRTEMWKSVLLALNLAWFGSRGIAQLLCVCVCSGCSCFPPFSCGFAMIMWNSMNMDLR